MGKFTILKEDHFPGIESETLPQEIPGAPNFRGMSDFPIYGVGTPTIDGIRRVLCAIGSGPSNKRCSTLWFNWRQEPLVYINGRPLVLREDQRPFKNLKEYSKINRHRLEKMEERLKQDILHEAAHHDGKILVALERPSPNVVGILEDKWEAVSGESVLTPASVYDILRKEGYDVEYRRLPLTDGRTPDASFPCFSQKAHF